MDIGNETDMSELFFMNESNVLGQAWATALVALVKKNLVSSS